MKKVLLINPPSGLYRRDDRCQSRVEDQTVRIIFPPMDLAYLAAAAQAAGAQARIEDFPASGKTWQDFKAILRDYAPDILVISVTSATASEDLKAASAAKEICPSCLTLAKGEYVVYFSDKILRDFPDLDALLTGDIEAALSRVINGEWAAGGGQLIHGEPSSAFERLFPARDLLDNRLYRSPETGNPLTVIQANRGCSAHCIFCPAGALSGYKLQLRAPAHVVAEAKECVERFGIREFLFNGDTFTMNKAWMLELCRRIREAHLDIRWGCNSRVDTFDRERAEALKGAGCWVVAFGVESGSQDMLDKMKKKTTLEQARRAVRCARAAGLCTHAFFIIGLPWETRETLQETLIFARELDTDFFDFNIAYPLPGTEYYEIAIRDGLINPDASGSYAQAAARTYTLSGEELTQWRRRALLSLYLRPWFILRTIMRVIWKPRIFMNYIREGFARLLYLTR
ncbi:MAG: Ribosomal protein S12 methylthiotransferase RimO [candidate division BRC1 bacterium ADurb.Bin183]|nr:MAG: Ribosomal protein S12 methylthiotransferase RimO [candidate division BRC1 bacterium ADurb.Bin183]